MDKILPESIRPEFITNAIETAQSVGIDLDAQAIAFEIKREQLKLFEDDNCWIGRHSEEDYGLVLHTKAVENLTIESKPSYEDRETEIPAFTIHEIEIGFDEGVPFILNAHLLEHPALNDDSLASLEIFIKMPGAILPRSIIKTADGRVFLSVDNAEDLKAEIEHNLHESVQCIIEELAEQAPPAPDAS